MSSSVEQLAQLKFVFVALLAILFPLFIWLYLFGEGLSKLASLLFFELYFVSPII